MTVIDRGVRIMTSGEITRPVDRFFFGTARACNVTLIGRWSFPVDTVRPIRATAQEDWYWAEQRALTYVLPFIL